MILVTGGSGFIGSHTVRALYDLGETSVLIQRRTLLKYHASSARSPSVITAIVTANAVSITARAA